MALHQKERELETLEQEADDLALIVASLDTSRLYMIGALINDELTLRHQGKPANPAYLH